MGEVQVYVSNRQVNLSGNILSTLDGLQQVKASWPKPIKPARDLNKLLTATFGMVACLVIRLPMYVVCFLCLAAITIVSKEEIKYNELKKQYVK